MDDDKITPELKEETIREFWEALKRERDGLDAQMDTQTRVIWDSLVKNDPGYLQRVLDKVFKEQNESK